MAERPKDSNLRLAPRTVARAIGTSVRDREGFRYHGVREAWSTVKRLGSAVENVEVREIPCVQNARVEGYIDDPNRGALAALCQGIGARTFLEIGTNRGRTAWTVARNNPEIRVYTIDLPGQEAIEEVALDVNESDRGFFVEDWDRGEAFVGTPEGERIEQLWGDSATFDFSPYEGKIDVVFIDGAHSYSYVKNDTEAALNMLTETGLIAWDDYPAIPGVYGYINEIATRLEPPPFHILGTRLVVYSRTPVVERITGTYGALHKA